MGQLEGHLRSRRKFYCRYESFRQRRKKAHEGSTTADCDAEQAFIAKETRLVLLHGLVGRRENCRVSFPGPPWVGHLGWCYYSPWCDATTNRCRVPSAGPERPPPTARPYSSFDPLAPTVLRCYKYQIVYGVLQNAQSIIDRLSPFTCWPSPLTTRANEDYDVSWRQMCSPSCEFPPAIRAPALLKRALALYFSPEGNYNSDHL